MAWKIKLNHRDCPYRVGPRRRRKYYLYCELKGIRCTQKNCPKLFNQEEQ